MKINNATVLTGSKVKLLPYLPAHVPLYHEWMTSSELLELTASEPLTLEEEYEMQKSWAVDEDKCTFIVIDLSRRSEPRSEESDKQASLFTSGMCGDVNLFFNDHDDKTVAEIEIMIAEQQSRRKGLGKETLLIMMNYGIQVLKVSKYVSKISLTNEPSITLFKSLGFQEVSVSSFFQEVTLELSISKDVVDWLAPLVSHVTESNLADLSF